LAQRSLVLRLQIETEWRACCLLLVKQHKINVYAFFVLFFSSLLF
jgi:hypothetical protein